MLLCGSDRSYVRALLAKRGSQAVPERSKSRARSQLVCLLIQVVKALVFWDGERRPIILILHRIATERIAVRHNLNGAMDVEAILFTDG